MKSTIVSVAAIFTLLASDGLAGSVSAESAHVGIVPAIDVPAPSFAGTEEAGRGGQAARIELDDNELYDGMSTWYRLAYVVGGTRLQVYEHYAVSSVDEADSDILRSENVAWQVANQLVEPQNRSTESRDLPRWARVRTGNNVGPSAGLMFTLTYIDLLTPGALVGDLRVAGTGGIAIDGYAFAFNGVNAKVVTAMLTKPDVVFTTKAPTLFEHVTVLPSHTTRDATSSDTIADLLNLNGYEKAGRAAADNPGTAAIVVVSDVRQALAWLCGRTDNSSVCRVAERSANILIERQ